MFPKMTSFLNWKVNNRREEREDKMNIQKRALWGVCLQWFFSSEFISLSCIPVFYILTIFSWGK